MRRYRLEIRKDGSWWQDGVRFSRQKLVRLFSTILRRDPDGYYLVTPHEKVVIRVEDAPFVATRLDRTEEGGEVVLAATTNVGDVVLVGEEHPLRVETDDETGEPSTYVMIRNGLEARLARPPYYELVGWANEDPDTRMMSVTRAASASSWAERFEGPMTFSTAEEFPGACASAPVPGRRAVRGRAARRPRPVPKPQGHASEQAQLARCADRAEANGDDYGVQLTLRPDTMAQHAGQVAFPGGRLDPLDGTLLDAALRESEEEIGLRRGQVEILGRSRGYLTGTGYLIAPFVGLIDRAFEPVPEPGEVADRVSNAALIPDESR